MKRYILFFILIANFAVCEFRSLYAQEPCASKLRSIVFEKIFFDEKDVVEAFEAVRAKSLEADKEGKGVNIILKDIKRGEMTVSLDLSDIPAGELIRYICISAGLEYKIENHAVVIYKSKDKKP